MTHVLLHGTLHITICEVDLLPSKGCCRFFCKLIENFEEAVGFGGGNSELYTTIDLENTRVGRTRVLKDDTSNPQWYESFHIYCAHIVSNINFSIKDDNPIGALLIGRASLPVQDILAGEEVDSWLKILGEDRKPLTGSPKLHVKLRYSHAASDSNWSKGIAGPAFPGVPYTFFPQRQGCRVTLYQDAHVHDEFNPKIPLSGGKKMYEPQHCWEDIFDAIANAKHLIYIAGWSIFPHITLLRDPERQRAGGHMTLGDLLVKKVIKKGVTLGELLVKKANEGVSVLMLVWDDRTSIKLLHDGIMSTHDEETESYFEDTKVQCVLCTRDPDEGQSLVQDLQTSLMFTHHQKTVVVDCEDIESSGSSEKRRRIVSFVGGLDLTTGRYDSTSHSLFSSMEGEHKGDFYQPSLEGASVEKGGPRQPWHDIHCRIEGPAAWDVLFNFEQRWEKQGEKDVLVKVRELDHIFSPQSQSLGDPEDTETWNVQLFRSIDGGAAFGFPDTPLQAARIGLVSGKYNIVDRSIQDAYINAIRRAKSFIYIENQYFIGSSFCWAKNDDLKVEEVGALQVIPKELSLKIVSKIEAGERFTVYVVIPMWPEGVPEDGAIQAMLNWQKRTMEMMYKDIVEALRVKGLEADPKDYLTFFCLGNREKKGSGEIAPLEKPNRDSNYSRAQQARRFMIYVHAKMMIVDDEYIIIGSANINQRSMDGARDSEIAMGGYQPGHLNTAQQRAKGQIHGLRMGLWYEHLGLLEDSFSEPESVECVRKINQTATKNWDMYCSKNLDRDLPGHLLTYPVRISGSGEILELPGTKCFPDTTASVLGCKPALGSSIMTKVTT